MDKLLENEELINNIKKLLNKKFFICNYRKYFEDELFQKIIKIVSEYDISEREKEKLFDNDSRKFMLYNSDIREDIMIAVIILGELIQVIDTESIDEYVEKYKENKLKLFNNFKALGSCIVCDGKQYDLSINRYFVEDISEDLYEDFSKWNYNENIEVKFNIIEDMRTGFIYEKFTKYFGEIVDIKHLENVFQGRNKKRTVVYSEVSQDKIILEFTPEDQSIEIYEFKKFSKDNASKYIHCNYNEKGKYFEHIDYSINIYDSEVYSDIFTNPSHTKKENKHIKLWLLKGKISKENFKTILNKMFVKNCALFNDCFKDIGN